MQKKTGAVVLGTLLGGACGLVSVGGLVFVAGQQSVQSAPAKLQKAVSGGNGWQTYTDARLGFAVARPAGWTVRGDSRSITVQDPGRSETVLMEAFTASPGDSAEEHLNRLAVDHIALFPDAEIGEATPQESKGEEVAASLTYENGAGQGRALCSVVKGKGLLFVLAAPREKFAADQPALTRIVKSLRFMVPAASAASAKGAAAQAAAAVRGLHFVSWTEPREHGFHLSVPAGWKADGGVFRFGPSDVRIAYEVRSPDHNMAVVVGDPRLPTAFQTLTAAEESIGMRDGMSGLLHFMPALEFNRWYLENFSKGAADNLAIGAEHPLPALSRQRTAEAQRAFGGGMQIEVSVGATEFSGRSEVTGKPMTGLILGTTERMTGGFGGNETTTWNGSPILLACTDDGARSHYQQTVMAVLTHLIQSFREDPAWAARRSRELTADGEHIAQIGQDTLERTRRMNEEALKRSAERSQQIARDSEAARESSMGAYWGHENAQAEQQRGFVNYLGDRTDVGGDGGPTVNVGSGSSHYYRNGQTGTILGTDSAYSPGVDFTPLTER